MSEDKQSCKFPDTLILDAAKQHDIEISELEHEVATSVRDKASNKFADGRTHWLWDSATDKFSVQEKDAWQWIVDFVGSKSALMFFNSGNSETVLRFERGADVHVILGETSHYEFYVTDDDVSYLLCFNHHDFLIAWGTAKSWLENRIRQSSSD